MVEQLSTVKITQRDSHLYREKKEEGEHRIQKDKKRVKREESN